MRITMMRSGLSTSESPGTPSTGSALADVAEIGVADRAIGENGRVPVLFATAIFKTGGPLCPLTTRTIFQKPRSMPWN